jgi:quinohemoprotein ethanol dehydrogenase
MKRAASTLGALLVALCSMTAAAGTVVSDKVLSNEAEGANWASYGRTYSENHYSPLQQIDATNVGRLGLVWQHDIAPVANTFAAPLAVDGVLYFAIGYSVVHAMDARTGKLLWTYDPHVPETAGRKLRGGWGIRGIAFWEGRIITGLHDGRLIALDARTGKLLWSVWTTEPNDSRYVTGPPWVFNGKVVIGHGGADFEPTRGYITAYDIRTGKQLWRFYTVPGNPKQPFETEALKMAAKTWSGDWWKFGGAGGTVWHAFAYDPQFKRLYFGTGNGWPWNPRIRSGGDNLFLTSIVAVDADTGKYAWHYQVIPSETWDYDACSDLELATLTIDGKSVPVLMQAGKNGFFYVIDRRNGKLISANNFTKVTWAERIDLVTGRPVELPGSRFENGVAQLVFPGPIGAHATQAMSFNPVSGLAYIPTTELGGVYTDPDGNLDEWQPRPGFVPNTGLGRARSPPPVPPGKSFLVAWDPIKQQQTWSVPLTGPVTAAR